MTDSSAAIYTGKAQVTFCQRLGKSWRDLALYLEIPESDCDRFEPGDEGRAILNWLRQRHRLHELPKALEFIGRAELALPFQPPAVSVEAVPHGWKGSPYPGLVPFTAEYAPVFFGRDRHTAALLERLQSHRFLAVVGASGSGKSSLVAAGLLPRLQANTLLGSQHWIALEFTPGGPGANPDPFTGLAYGLKPWLKPGLSVRDIDRKLRARNGLSELAGKVVAQRPSTELLLFIDQFEELFTLCAKEHHPLFINMLDEAANSACLRIVLTLRSDFVSPCLDYRPLAERFNAGLYSLPTPSVIDLHEMITRPAALAGLRFEDSELPLEILRDTGTEPGALALMAAALVKLYDKQAPDRILTRAAYEELGGVQGVINTLANNAYAALDVKAQAALGRVFRELVEVDPERGIPTRRRSYRSHFNGSPAASQFIDAFTRARLLVCNEDVVEVAHEALLRSWPRLVDWIDERRDDLRLLHQVKAAADEWQRQGQDPTHLWLHERLAPVAEMLDRLDLKAHLEEPLKSFLRPEDKRLQEELEHLETSHYRRAEIGDRLDRIGDPRLGVGLQADGLPDIVWCQIPDGRVKLKGHAGVFDVAPFEIAKYPVTYRQYRAFLDSRDGYINPDWWHGLEHEQQPGEQYRLFGNCPADNVSWYDAVAFCRWLSARLGYEVRLPTEWEWRQAATGGDPENVYPWGREWESGSANTFESKLGRTTAVGMYPAGASKQRVMDLAGTIWEWCLNKRSHPKDTDFSGDDERVLCGGSWGDGQGIARAMFHRGDRPRHRYVNLGFRVARCSSI